MNKKAFAPDMVITAASWLLTILLMVMVALFASSCDTLEDPVSIELSEESAKVDSHIVMSRILEMPPRHLLFDINDQSLYATEDDRETFGLGSNYLTEAQYNQFVATFVGYETIGQFLAGEGDQRIMRCGLVRVVNKKEMMGDYRLSVLAPSRSTFVLDTYRSDTDVLYVPISGNRFIQLAVYDQQERTMGDCLE